MTDLVMSMMAKNPIQPAEGDYQEGGLWYCGKCRAPKQARVVINGHEFMPMAKCRCPEPPTFVRPEGVPQEWNFEQDDQTAKASRAARKYCELFPTENGLLFYGAVGTGKSFLSGCICNALAAKGFSTIMDTARGFADKAFNDHGFIDRLCRYDLLVLDDLNAERQTDYMAETVYQIVNARWQARRPMLVTTNLTSEQMKNPANVTDARIFSRILARCVPVLVTGVDRRREQGKSNLEEWRKILNG